MIPLSVPNLKGNEEKYVLDAVRTEWVSTGGGYINQFEKNIAKYLNVEQAVACQSGTAGLHLALIACDVTCEDEVIVPTLTFIAAVNPIKYLGATPIFMDCDNSLCMDMEKLEDFLQTQCDIQNDKLVNKATGKIIKAVVVVHVFGNLANMEKLVELSKKFGFKIIEDATEALGTYQLNNKKFAGTFGDFGVFSFNGNKIITTGGGGMIVSNDTKKLNYIKYLSTQAKDDELNYIHNDVGYNYRMTNLQAALGVAQLEQLENFIATKKNNYAIYKEETRTSSEIKLLNFREDIRPNYWFYSLLLENETPTNMINICQQNKIQVRPIWGLIHEQKPYKNCEAYKIEKAKYYQKKIINIPCSSNLTKEEVLLVVQVLVKG
ncbi:MAG: aminotransferase DegT [Epulopiscium sp. Nele67-Bin005]|nr:MAG: aminotransferase DegT [Epulopiscium sp. Nele67-Bin005]